MKILQINNCHYRRGGADVVYLNTGKLLEEKGNEVIYYSQASPFNLLDGSSTYFIDAIDFFKVSKLKKILQIPRFFYSNEAALKLQHLINLENPEVAHIHTYKGTLTPSILKILKKNIQNNSENYTRFLVIAKRPQNLMYKTPKTSICFELKNIPGALFKGLSVFALREINLVKIESRPIPHKPFEYRFYADFLGDLKEERVKNALKNLAEISLSIRIFGTYEKGEIYKS